MYKTVIYILSVLLSIFIVSGINFNNFLRQIMFGKQDVL